MCSPPWELELRPLGVATGNALSVTRVWRYICKNTTCWPATAHDVTTGVPQYKCRREDTSSAFSSSLTGLFEACNLVRVQFSLYQMASTSKAFKIVCGKIGTHRDDTHNLCVFCLGNEHARDVLEGKSACTMSFFYVKAPLSSCPSFRGKRGSRLLPAIRDPPLPRHGGNELAVGCGRWVRKKRGTPPPFRARRPRTRVSCWIVTMRSFWHKSDSAASALLCIWTSFFGGLWIIKKKKSNFFSYS